MHLLYLKYLLSGLDLFFFVGCGIAYAHLCRIKTGKRRWWFHPSPFVDGIQVSGYTPAYLFMLGILSRVFRRFYAPYPRPESAPHTFAALPVPLMWHGIEVAFWAAAFLCLLLEIRTAKKAGHNALPPAPVIRVRVSRGV
jgi:hypothetical protein